MSHGYKIRSFTTGKSKGGSEYKAFSLTVPSDIATALPENMTFIPRMTDEGLLYVPSTKPEGALELPEWAKTESN
jgi:hypothetical protein